MDKFQVESMLEELQQSKLLDLDGRIEAIMGSPSDTPLDAKQKETEDLVIHSKYSRQARISSEYMTSYLKGRVDPVLLQNYEAAVATYYEEALKDSRSVFGTAASGSYSHHHILLESVDSVFKILPIIHSYLVGYLPLRKYFQMTIPAIKNSLSRGEKDSTFVGALHKDSLMDANLFMEDSFNVSHEQANDNDPKYKFITYGEDVLQRSAQRWETILSIFESSVKYSHTFREASSNTRVRAQAYEDLESRRGSIASMEKILDKMFSELSTELWTASEAISDFKAAAAASAEAFKAMDSSHIDSVVLIFLTQAVRGGLTKALMDSIEAKAHEVLFE